MLELYMEEHSIQREGSTFYSHLLPCLETPAWKRTAWQATLDGHRRRRRSGGSHHRRRTVLRHAISGPRDAHLAETKRSSRTEQAYRWLLRRDFAADLELGSRLAHRIFHGNYLFGTVPARMIQFTRRSPTFRDVMQDLFSGTQNYIGLKGRLLRNLNGSLFEIIGSFGFGRLVPQKG